MTVFALSRTRADTAANDHQYGIVTLFVQLYESNTEAVKSEIATFFEAFPKGMIFANTYNGAGYDVVMVGTEQPLRIDLSIGVDLHHAGLSDELNDTVHYGLVCERVVELVGVVQPGAHHDLAVDLDAVT